MKKTILILTILFINSINTFAQTNNIDLKTLEKILEMSSNQFEDWALINGLELINTKEIQRPDLISYGFKNNYSITIALDNYGNTRGYVQYSTNNNINYISIKKKCLFSGYKFIISEYCVNGEKFKNLCHKYESKTNNLTFYTIKESEVYSLNICLEYKNIR